MLVYITYTDDLSTAVECTVDHSCNPGTDPRDTFKPHLRAHTAARTYPLRSLQLLHQTETLHAIHLTAFEKLHEERFCGVRTRRQFGY